MTLFFSPEGKYRSEVTPTVAKSAESAMTRWAVPLIGKRDVSTLTLGGLVGNHQPACHHAQGRANRRHEYLERSDGTSARSTWRRCCASCSWSNRCNGVLPEVVDRLRWEQLGEFLANPTKLIEEKHEHRPKIHYSEIQMFWHLRIASTRRAHCHPTTNSHRPATERGRARRMGRDRPGQPNLGDPRQTPGCAPRSWRHERRRTRFRFPCRHKLSPCSSDCHAPRKYLSPTTVAARLAVDATNSGRNGLARIHERVKRFVDQQTGQPAVPHGFRASFSTWANENGFDPSLDEACLAHQLGTKVSRAYNRGDKESHRAELLTAWGAFVTARTPNWLTRV